MVFEADGPELGESLMVFVFPLRQEVDLDSFMVTTRKRYQNTSLGKFQEYGLDDVTLGGQKAKRWEISLMPEARTVDYYLLRGRAVYLLQFTVPAERFAERRPVYEEIAGSLRFED